MSCTKALLTLSISGLKLQANLRVSIIAATYAAKSPL